MLEFIHNNMLPCVIKQTIGIDCPGCGMQRSILALLEGDLFTSFMLFPALPFLMLMFTALLFHLKNNGNISLYFVKYSFLISALLMAFSWIIKLF